MAEHLPISIYDIKIKSADETQDDLLGQFKGKVTLIFNVAAGCGNIPQHMILQELNERYADEPDFNILAITVDDFRCHGYPEFQDGLDSYKVANNLDISPGLIAQRYAEENFQTTYNFSELTNGRYDKHRYEKSFIPGSVKEQEIHPLWFYLTEAYSADVGENGLPYHEEHIPWSIIYRTRPPAGKRGFIPLTGNFEKFLVDRSGRRIKRYANSFLLGQRDKNGEEYPWFEPSVNESGRPAFEPNHNIRPEGPENNGPFPTPLQRKGINLSLDEISNDIDAFLAETW